MGVYSFLQHYRKQEMTSFHTPGHKGERFFRENGYGDFLNHMLDHDLTEIEGSDNLQQPEGVLRETMDRYRRLYGARESFLLVNGSTAGLVAGVLTVARAGDTVILARNSHKSLFHGIQLAGAKVEYAFPEYLREFHIAGAVSPEEVEHCLDEHPESVAIVITSPNYYGILSDVEAIAKVVHERGKILIVDQAHGAHLPFWGEGKSAEEQGADLVINSTHKTMASFTQSSIANICSDRIDPASFASNLNMLQSTSPSYLLMASLDINADLLEKRGAELMGNWKRSLAHFYEKAALIPGLSLMEDPMLDCSKLNLDMSAVGLDGQSLAEALRARGIEPELYDRNLVMCLTGIGNGMDDYKKLLAALSDIARSGKAGKGGPSERKEGASTLDEPPQWMLRSHPREKGARSERKIKMPILNAVGRTCAESLIPYPPGIPIVCEGEVLTLELVEELHTILDAGREVLGVGADEKIFIYESQVERME